MDGWMDGWMDEWMVLIAYTQYKPINNHLKEDLFCMNLPNTAGKGF